ncbi:GAF domain-containing protein [Actinoplanes sp. KI2]|uniref:GAF domain-containing protein n=1 Tax=Actinoplanes sp. KI2 TaxID=2983315 RepID=UPI0021D5F65A|nr:GAF domain-containing protein [Actinoplanes sp. KI2]MCU7730683.1 GAF domain-containing protein [Actinoplanes sp. KI2]
MNGTSAPVLAETDPLSAELLQSVVDVARAIFGAQASSVFLLDEQADELIFHSVSGRGEGFLVGRRFPAGRGIAGWVLASGEPMVATELSRHAAFDRGLAESTQYVPDSLMAAPLVHGGRMLGVLEVLDPVPQSRSSLDELDLLALFARQAAAALRVVVDRHSSGGAGRRQRLDDAFVTDRQAAARQLLEDLQQLLEAPVGQGPAR